MGRGPVDLGLAGTGMWAQAALHAAGTGIYMTENDILSSLPEIIRRLAESKNLWRDPPLGLLAKGSSPRVKKNS
jgi:hypothetical protein